MHMGFVWIHVDSYVKTSEVCKLTIPHKEQ
jgi:hypothetical protein